jgi:hypothetical protein
MYVNLPPSPACISLTSMHSFSLSLSLSLRPHIGVVVTNFTLLLYIHGNLGCQLLPTMLGVSLYGYSGILLFCGGKRKYKCPKRYIHVARAASATRVRGKGVKWLEQAREPPASERTNERTALLRRLNGAIQNWLAEKAKGGRRGRQKKAASKKVAKNC